MITFIQIRHFTIVDELSLDLSSGMTVLTGETGAGKSILLDALGLALGGRAETSFIRNGKDSAEISVEFDLSKVEDARQWLMDYALFDDEDSGRDNPTCLIRRVINREGPSKAFINGRPVNTQTLRELGDMLVDIHGQHAHQSLMKRDLQRQSLDDFAQNETLLSAVKTCYNTLKSLKDQKIALQQHANEREAKIDLLTYQVQELTELDLQAGEITELDLEQRKLANITNIKDTSEQSLFQLKDADDGSLLSQFNQVLSALARAADFDTAISAIHQQLTEAQIQTQEAAEELRHYVDNLSLDSERLQWIDDRLATALDLSRKHRIKPEQIPDLAIKLAAELDSLQSTNIKAGQLDEKIQQATKDYQQAAIKLTKQRNKAATTLQNAVTENLQTLGMKQGKFAVILQPLEEISPGGMERVEYCVAANPGQPMGPLNKVASGGELSRISLAIQVITARTGRIPCLIFDEVDVGIGGGTAEVVGRLMRSLSQDRQVLCVTHQPQVASLAHHHLHVGKHNDGKTTSTSITLLDKKSRTAEIARMLGGIDITTQTLSHAEEMLKNSYADSTIQLEQA